MLERILEVIPFPVIVFAAIYATTCWFLAPGVAERKHAAAAVVACEVGVRAEEANARRLRSSGEDAIAVFDGMQDLFDALPGGKAVFDGLRNQLEITRTPAPSKIDVEHCRCLVRQTVRDMTVRTDFALWLGSLKLIEETGVSDFAGHVPRKKREGVCGKAVL